MPNSTSFKHLKPFFSFLTYLLFSTIIIQAQTLPGASELIRGTGELTKVSVQLLLNFDNGNHNSADGFAVVFKEGYSNEVGDEDSYKFGNLDENLAIDCNGIALSIEGRPAIVVSDTIPIKIWQFRQKTYFLKIAAINFSSRVNAFLKDEYLHEVTSISLSTETIIPFNITDEPASSASNRFSIIFESFSTLPVFISSVKAYKTERGIQVAWNNKNETNVNYYEVERSANGVQFEKVCVTRLIENNTTGNNNWLDVSSNNSSNFYRIKVVEKSGVSFYSAIVRLCKELVKPSFSIFPNPVVEKEIGIKVSDLEKGKYTLNIYNGNGQKMFETFLDNKGGLSLQTISLRQKLTSGNYTIQLSNQTTILNQSIIMQ